MLMVERVYAHYGKIEALKEICLEVMEGEIVAVIGSNGAGKTTLLSTISGLVRATRGNISFCGKRIERMRAEDITRLGISHVPEGRKLFVESTVLENLEIGAFTIKSQDDVKANMERFLGIFPVLRQRMRQTAGSLSGGEQQMLAISRALMSAPKLLLMDEPSMGLAPLLVNEIFRVIRDLKEEGTTMLLVEQNAVKALAVAGRGYVLETGSILLSGSAEMLAKDEKVKDAYLGLERG